MNTNYTYIYRVLSNNKLCRWNKSLINVYINYSEVGPHLDKVRLENRIKSSFAVWENALEGKLKFNFVDNFNEDCNIYIDFQRNNCVGAIGQCTFSNILPSGEFKRMYITLGLIWTQLFDATVIHEIGHALGIIGHSPHNLDIMYESANPAVTGLSVKDINTIRLMYKLPLGCNREYIERHLGSILDNTYEGEEQGNNIVQYPMIQNRTEIDEYRDISQETFKIGVINILKIEQSNIELSPDVNCYLEDMSRNRQKYCK